ncbi:MAG: ABC transporter substrate-binding protein [Proteobacteria bacterium]|nr:ABC transporter substrate-binding protein [Pseudomonadota bacterium]
MRILRVLVISLLLISVGAKIGAGEAKKIKVGILPTSSMLPLFLAQERGWYDEAGLEVELIKMRGGATILPAIAGDSIQVGYSNVISIMLARSTGLDFQIITNHVNEGYTKKAGEPGGYATSSSGVLVLPDSGIKGPKDLEGKKVAVNAIKNIDWMAVWEWMEKNGADPNKITWVEVGFPKMIPALMGKKVDAVEATEPFKTILRSKEALLLVNTLHDLRPGLTLASFVAKEEWINKNSEAIQGFVSATARGQEYLNTHPEERNQLVTKYTKVSLELAEKMTWHDWQSRVDLESMDLWIKLCQKHGLLEEAPDLKKLIYKTAM